MAQDNPGCLTSFLNLFGIHKQPKKRTITHIVMPGDYENEDLPYFIRDDFLSEAESSFFRVLQNTLQGRQLIFAKVSLGDLFFVSHPEENMAYYNKINRKHVDFLLCDPQTLKPTVGIELDDSSHTQSKRIERDEFVDALFETAGLPLVRVPVRQAYSSQELIELIKAALQQNKSQPESQGPEKQLSSPSNEPPVCPKCGSSMVMRTAQRGSNAGQQFYGCTNYPKCRGVIPISGVEEA
jgi:hypothetical protein